MSRQLTSRLVAVGVAVAVATCLLVRDAAQRPRDLLTAVATRGADVEHGDARAVPSFRANDRLAIEASFARESHRPGTTARLRFESTLRAVRLQFFHVGPEWGQTVGNMRLRGVPVTQPVLLAAIRAGGNRQARSRSRGRSARRQSRGSSRTSGPG